MTAPPIDYDLPIRNLIAELDATGHVSHVQHRKTHVTLHHNGGWLSHDGILNVWRTREASAHFNIDSQGTAGQFVGVNEYAWACGNTEGNQRSISIEHCNIAGAPSWAVAEITWQRGARLAGWLFARVIGARPTRETLVFHKHWNATDCAGPWMDRLYDLILAVAQKTFDSIVHGIVTEEGKHMVRVLQGDGSDKHYLVEVTGEGAGKKWLKTTTVSTVFQTLLGEPVTKVPQWTLDYIDTTGSIPAEV